MSVIKSFPGSEFATNYDLVCFSHLRWNFVFQRPQHLLSRFARGHNVFFIEEPIFHDGDNRMDVQESPQGVKVCMPHLRHGSDHDASLRTLIDELLSRENVSDYVCWYYTPMMLNWSRHLKPRAVVYDCMDELSAFKNAPPELHQREAELFGLSDLVFTGGRSLYEVKRGQHPSVYCFPSSIEVQHFSQALTAAEPGDQQSIPHPRIGFAGVIDERTDIGLLTAIADTRPDWHFVMIGPVVKIDEADLPQRDNIHYLGGKDYNDLPAYIGGWDVAMMPFAMNDSTKFISPTKTPEYLAAGRPVVSTPIRDVVRPYGENGLVFIASTADEFVSAIESAMNVDLAKHREAASDFLATDSWDRTQQAMEDLINEIVAREGKGMAASQGRAV